MKNQIVREYPNVIIICWINRHFGRVGTLQNVPAGAGVCVHLFSYVNRLFLAPDPLIPSLSWLTFLLFSPSDTYYLLFFIFYSSPHPLFPFIDPSLHPLLHIKFNYNSQLPRWPQ